MTCPFCQSKMTKGKVAAYASTLDLILGLLHQRLWFHPDDNPHQARKVALSWPGAPAWGCVKCGAVLIVPNRTDDL